MLSTSSTIIGCQLPQMLMYWSQTVIYIRFYQSSFLLTDCGYNWDYTRSDTNNLWNPKRRISSRQMNHGPGWTDRDEEMQQGKVDMHVVSPP